ncbi:MAG: trehalose-phosphatase [Desulfatiglandaceae bacterium]
MKILNNNINFDLFCDQFSKAAQKALLLDYDGTLAPFHTEPDKAFPYPGVRAILGEIMRETDIRVVIITGRWIKDLMPLLQLEKRPEIWGSHGLERLKSGGSYELAPMDEETLNGLVAADEWVDAAGLSERCEKKPGSIAIHWRGLDAERVKDIRGRVEPEWNFIAQGWGLSLKEFDGGLEISVPGRNKGDAVKTILTEMGRGAPAAYLGDDFTDEDAFKAIKGRGMGILVRAQLRPTAADMWIQPPEELLPFLSSMLPGDGRKYDSPNGP